MRIKLKLSGKATYNLREVIADYGFEWNGRSWYRNFLSEDLEKVIKILKDDGIIFYHGDFLLGSMGCTLTVQPTSYEGFERDSKESDVLMSEFDSITSRLEKACVGDYLSKEDHYTMRRFYDGYGGWEEIATILEERMGR